MARCKPCREPRPDGTAPAPARIGPAAFERHTSSFWKGASFISPARSPMAAQLVF
jgi:hypothetical protein